MKLSDIKKIDTDFKINLENQGNISELTVDCVVEVIKLPVDKIKAYRHQARKAFNDDDLISLADTIMQHGIRQPLTVLRYGAEDFQYEVVSGERRLRAAIIAGLKVVPCIVIENESVAQELAIIENTQRQDLHVIELMNALVVFQKNNPHLTPEEIYKKIGMSRTHFYRLLSLVKLSTDVKEYAVQQNISANILYDIVKLNEDRQMVALLRKINSNQEASEMRKTTNKRIIKISVQNNQVTLKTTGIKNITKEEKLKILDLLRDLINQVEGYTL